MADGVTSLEYLKQRIKETGGEASKWVVGLPTYGGLFNGANKLGAKLGDKPGEFQKPKSGDGTILYSDITANKVKDYPDRLASIALVPDGLI